jgi:hypothetical protein
MITDVPGHINYAALSVKRILPSQERYLSLKEIKLFCKKLFTGKRKSKKEK